MPLNPSSLANDLKNIDGSLSEHQSAQQYAQALSKFFDSAMGPGGSTVMSASGMSNFSQMVEGVYKQKGTVQTCASQIASAAATWASSFQIFGGAFGTSIVIVAIPSSLSTGLSSAWSGGSKSTVTNSEAQAWLTFCQSIIASGTGVTPAPPVAGPLS